MSDWKRIYSKLVNNFHWKVISCFIGKLFLVNNLPHISCGPWSRDLKNEILYLSGHIAL